MIIIENRIFVDILVDGNSLPSTPNLLESLVLTEGNGALSPAVRLTLNDTRGSLGRELALTDGNEILVTVGRSPESLKTVSRQYRLFGHTQRPSTVGPQIVVVGILDALGFLTASTTESFKGNSSQALLEIATRSNMCYSGPEDYNGRTPLDNQRWRSVCQSRATNAQDISRHGYIDEHSAMVLIADSLGCLKYRNITDLLSTQLDKITRVFAHNVIPGKKDSSNKTVYLVRDARDRSSAGLMNNWQNYGSYRQSHSLSGLPEEHTAVDVKTNGSFLAINSKVAEASNKSRKDYGPLDCGNTHKNYERALYQNLKQLALLSEKLSILVLDVTDVQLLDVVIYRQADVDLLEPVKNSDVYLVIGKSIMVKGGRSYAERIELARMSLTTKGSAELKCVDPTKDAASALPNVVINPTVATAAAGLSSVKTISSLAKSASDKLRAVRDFAVAATGKIRAVAAGVRAVVSGIRSLASPAGLLSALTSAVPLIGEVIQTVVTLKDAATSSLSALRGMRDDITSLADVPKQLVKSILGLPGGIMSLYSTALGGTRQLQDTNSITQGMGQVAFGSVGYTPGGTGFGEAGSTSGLPEFASIRTTAGAADLLLAMEIKLTQLAYQQAQLDAVMKSHWNETTALLGSVVVPSSGVLFGHSGGNYGRVLDGAFTTSSISLNSVLGVDELSLRAQLLMLPGPSGALPWESADPVISPRKTLTTPLQLDDALDSLELDSVMAEQRYKNEGLI